MKQILTFLFFSLFCSNLSGQTNETLPFVPLIHLSEKLINDKDYIKLDTINSWYFKKGNDPNGARVDQDTSKWKKLRPFDLDETFADKNKRREGWFRTYIQVDSSMTNKPIHFNFETFGAADIFINEKLIHSFGVIGTDKDTYKEYSPTHRLPIQFTLTPGKTYALSIHFVDYVIPFVRKNHNKGLPITISDKESRNIFEKHIEEEPFYNMIWLSAGTLLCLLFWILALQNRKERNLRLIALTTTSLLALSISIWMPHNPFASAFVTFVVSDFLGIFAGNLTFVFSILLLVNLFNRRVTTTLKIFLGLILLNIVVELVYPNPIGNSVVAVLTITTNVYYIISSRKSLKGAQWFVVAGVMLTYLIAITFIFLGFLNSALLTNTVIGLFTTGIFLSLPLCLLLYISVRFKEFIRDVQQNAQRIVQLSVEKKQQALQQQKVLEEEVTRQTIDLRNSLETLRATQSQLIQSEKMASLGELTAGIAHEIQNPLNFVNNFSDVSIELLEEMETEIDKGDLEEAKVISADIKQNLEKINHHGKRADAIVKGMLLHSRNNSGTKEPTDLNALCDEYLRLSYHGLRAKDKSFNATLNTDFDATIGKIEIIPQDLGRVILNLLTNAFYAVNEKMSLGIGGYEPTVSISTKKIGNTIEIRVSDNGNGIPQSAIDKIFQPFFTTKPTGQGTGLGLSLAYDIVKAHGGELTVDLYVGEQVQPTQKSTGTIFTVSLPINQ